MENTVLDIKSELEFLLISALPNQNFKNCKFEIVGTSGKGDGYVSDIYFVNLTTANKNYKFALKCGNEIFRNNIPIRHLFENEIFVYNTVLPTFRKFENKRNIDNVFDSMPKCYGTFTYMWKKVIILENLKSKGYELWDKRLPFPRSYIETVLKQYGRFHAISTVIQEQEPEEFGKLLSNVRDTWGEFCATNFAKAFTIAVENVGKIWENDMEESVLNRWKLFAQNVEFYVLNLRRKTKRFNVITHGDCWNNNFMFKTIKTDGKEEVKVAMIDWQLSGFASPVTDIAYFLYSCISPEDLQDFDDLLKLYYESFAEHLRKLGGDPEKIYTYSNLLDDWKIYARLGIIASVLLFTLFCYDHNDMPDLKESAKNDGSIIETFCSNINDVDYVKQRSGFIIRHAVERNFIESIEEFL